MTVWHLLSWKMTGNIHKSEAEVTCLVNDIIKVDDFSIKDLRDFNAHTKMKHFDASEEVLNPKDMFQRDGWKEADVEILVPTRERNPTGNGKPFSVSGFFYCSLTGWGQGLRKGWGQRQ
ncbi:hypothetical protein BV22DRAFT_1022401 [Leucogyrophana mollusca]|uniref:Uncharacterized protein n=1 Tax=Leucogyrophana mollusca TaxID=85980 RepID=A0ACB8B2J4_9AGAM|nr:hypothetical protein BV22DRAFT_1022401 [Leucogyrophana mollusca]